MVNEEDGGGRGSRESAQVHCASGEHVQENGTRALNLLRFTDSSNHYTPLTKKVKL